MEVRIGRECSIRDRKSVFQIWRCLPLRLSYCLRGRGTHIVLRGARMLPSMDPAAVFTVREMPARHGLVSMKVEMETDYQKAIGDALVSTLRRTVSACTRSSK